MSASKTLQVYGLFGNVESAYLTLPSLNGTNHSIQVAEPLELADDYAFPGDAPPNPGSGDSQLRRLPTGRIVKPWSFKAEVKGGGAAYSASVKPRDLSLGLRVAGFSETLDSTGSNEKYTYALVAPWGAPSSGGFEAYGRALTTGNIEKWPIVGAYADWTLDIADGKPAIFTFDFPVCPIVTDPSEVAWPTFAYAPTVLVPNTASIAFTLNSISSHIVRSVQLKGQREIGARFPNHNAAGLHAGAQPGGRAVMLTAVIETPAMATFDAIALRKAATAFAGSFQVGSTQYNRMKVNLPQLQVSDVSPGADGKTALQTITMTAHSSTPVANDSVNIVFD